MTSRRNFLRTGILSLGALPFMGTTVALPKNIFSDKLNDNGMKRLGLIGGTSWHSTVDYYRYINQMVNDIKDDRINPPLLIFNLNQYRINELPQMILSMQVQKVLFYVQIQHTLFMIFLQNELNFLFFILQMLLQSKLKNWD